MKNKVSFNKSKSGKGHKRQNNKKHKKGPENSPVFSNKADIGVIKTNRKGTGYIDIDDSKSVFFPESNLNQSLNGDKVKYILTGRKDNRSKNPIGKVSKIIERAKTQLVGTVEIENGNVFVLPDDKRIYKRIILPNEKSLEKNTKVFVSFEWKHGSEYPEGKLIEIIGKAKKHETEMKSIILEKGFSNTFPIEVEKEAERLRETKSKISNEEYKDREDFRGKLTFTIDPTDAKDFDDALSIESLPNGNFEIGVHIADVSFFVEPETELDKEAQNREFSVYLVDRTIPMLPEALSNDLCSLNPNEEKRAFSAIFELNKDGKVIKKRFSRTVILSDKRFTYEEAEKSINDSKGLYHKELKTLNDIAKKLQAIGEKNGAIDFETDEIKFELDKDGKPISIKKKERLQSHKLIEEYMLLANREVAHFISKGKDGKDLPSLFRVHDSPNKDKIEDLSIFIKALGHNLDSKKGVVTNRNIQVLLKSIVGTNTETLIKTAVLRSMAKATYETKNIGHFGLGFEYYTHFTSPIRRYPDLIIHRILAKRLSGKQISNKEKVFFKTVSKKASERELSAVDAERSSIKYKQVEYMKNHIGETFDALISGVTDWGIYVEETETKSEGLIRITSLPSDYYQFDQKNYCLVGKKTKKKYSLGDRVKVTLIKADEENNTLDFELQ